MAKRRITLTTQEMNEITSRTTTLESQLTRSNARVDELEKGLVKIGKLIGKKTKPKDLNRFLEEISQLVADAINPPVLAKELAKELARQAEATAG